MSLGTGYSPSFTPWKTIRAGKPENQWLVLMYFPIEIVPFIRGRHSDSLLVVCPLKPSFLGVFITQGSLNGTHLGGIKECKYMVILRDFL